MRAKYLGQHSNNVNYGFEYYSKRPLRVCVDNLTPWRHARGQIIFGPGKRQATITMRLNPTIIIDNSNLSGITNSVMMKNIKFTCLRPLIATVTITRSRHRQTKTNFNARSHPTGTIKVVRVIMLKTVNGIFTNRRRPVRGCPIKVRPSFMFITISTPIGMIYPMMINMRGAKMTLYSRRGRNVNRKLGPNLRCQFRHL